MKRFIPLIIILLALFSFAACNRSENPSANPAASGATITASPNPVPTSQGLGTTTITWNTGDGTNGQVYVSPSVGESESLVAAGPTGSIKLPWIQAGKTSEFRLYAGTEHAKVLAKTQVTGQQ